LSRASALGLARHGHTKEAGTVVFALLKAATYDPALVLVVPVLLIV
jgi:hypothetical protein